MTLTLNFQCQILKLLYLRNGRTDQYETKAMWVDRMSYLLCDLELWPWPWVFKVKFWKNLCRRNGRVDWPWKKRIWIDRMLWLWTLTSLMTLTLEFQLKYWNCCISGMGGLTDLEWKGCELDMMLGAEWDWPRATLHDKYISQVIGQCETLTVPTCWPMNGLFVHWSRGWRVLLFSERHVKITSWFPRGQWVNSLWLNRVRVIDFI